MTDIMCDLLRETQREIQSRAMLEQKLSADRKERRLEIFSNVITTLGFIAVTLSCLCVESSTKIMVIGSLIGLAMIAAAALINIKMYKED